MRKIFLNKFLINDKLELDSNNRLKDLSKIKKYHSKLLNHLTKYLFKYHYCEINKKVLRLMIHTWLNYYLNFYFMRWNFFNKNILTNKKNYFPDIDFKKFEQKKDLIIDTIDFYDVCKSSKIFNYLALKRIAVFKNKNIKNKIIFYKEKKFKDNFFLNRKKSFFSKFFFKLFFNFERLFYKPKIFIDKFFPFYLSSIIKINSYVLPINYKYLFDWKKIKIIEVFKKDLFLRQKFELQKIKTNDEFLRFIQDQIIDDLPIFICEGLDTINKYASLIYKPKLTISYVSHVHNELYKYWVLDQNLNKKSVNIGVHHGGDHQILDVLLNYNRLFCDYNYISWTKNKTSDINLPISKYVFPKKRIKNPKKLIMIDHAFTKYEVIIRNGPMKNHFNQTINYLTKIENHLDKNIKKNFEYIPKHFDLHIDKKSKIRKYQPSAGLKLNHYLSRSRLSICTYPQTAYFDSLVSGPTILIINPKYWKESKIHKVSYKVMKKNNLLFYDIDEVINFINKNWHNIDEWWNNKDTIKAKKIFLNNFNINFDKINSIKLWTNFIKKRINNA